jgi:predicted NBD/HSP70 family sugar kinase
MKKGEKPKNLKLHNTQTILDLVIGTEVTTVAEISEAIKLSKTTVKKIFDTLVEEGLLLSAGKGESTDEGGKKPELYCFNPRYGYVASIHVTPDKIISVTTDLKADIDFRQDYSISHQAGLEELMPLLSTAIHESHDRKKDTGQKLIGIVIALPGLADSTTGISIYSPHYPSWGRNVPFVRLLRDTLGEGWDVPIFTDVVNRYQAIAEREKGIAREVRNYLVIDALEEGLGAGLVLDGQLLQGNQSLSGELGHITIDSSPGSERCICGNTGCFEAMVSARRILRLAALARKDGRTSRLFNRGRRSRYTLEDVCTAADLGDPLCRELVAEAARWFILGFGNIIMIMDPELIVLQGVYVKAGAYLLDLLQEGISRIGLPVVEKRVRIGYSKMGDDRGVIGGAAVAISSFFENRRGL